MPDPAPRPPAYGRPPGQSGTPAVGHGGYPAQGYPSSGYPGPGYAAPGYPSPGYPSASYPAPGYPLPGQAPAGYATAPAYAPQPGWGWMRAPSIPDHIFFADNGPPRILPMPTRIAASEAQFGLMLLAIGFAAVFVNQANIFLQIILGAPVFEEMFKFGLALWLATLLGVDRLVGRLPIAWLVGLGFGAFEHWMTYSGEDLGGLIQRMAFHTLAPGLSMVTYHVLRQSRRPVVRWFAILPAAFVHFVNNTLAVVLLFASAGVQEGTPQAARLEDLASAISLSCVAALAALYVLAAFQSPLRRLAERAVMRRRSGLEVWPATPPAWGQAEAQPSAPH